MTELQKNRLLWHIIEWNKDYRKNLEHLMSGAKFSQGSY